MANKWHDLYKRAIKTGLGGGTQVTVGDIKKTLEKTISKRKKKSKGGSAKGKK